MAKTNHEQRQNEVLTILNAAKKLLKQKKISYQDVAKHWHLSLPAVKAAMNSRNLPLSRLLSLCDLLEISMKDLLAITQRDIGKEFRFTEEQEIFFSKNPTYMSYLFEISCKSIEEIECLHKISRKSSKQYLKVLEKMGLIQIMGEKVKSKINGPVLWSDHGPLGETFSKVMILQFAKWAADKITNPKDMYVQLHGWKLTPEQYKEYQKENRRLTDKFRDVSSLNKEILPKNQQETISVMILGDYWDCPTFTEIKEL